jgi:recombination protein RecA
MASSLRSDELFALLESRFPGKQLVERPPVPVLPTGISALDEAVEGIPRGALTEIHGPASSGKTSVLHSILAHSTGSGEVCALVDAGDAFDPISADRAGVRLNSLLWVRCGGNIEHALKAADLLAQAGGFGVVAFDLGGIPPMTVRRIPLSCWYRIRRAVENTPTVLVVLDHEPYAKSCASLTLEMRQEQALWSGAPRCSRLFRGMRVQAVPLKPVRIAPATFEIKA